MNIPAPTEALPGRWETRVGGLPRAFWALWTGALVNRLGAFVAPFLVLYLTRTRGLSISQAGLVLSAHGLGLAISQPVGGVLADRVGRRRTMVGGLVAAATTLVLVGAATSLPLLCLAVFVYGISADLYRPASQAAIADLVDEKHRPRAYALLFWAINLGFAVATLLAGFLADRGYWLLFLGDAATSLVFAAVILRGVPETRPQHHREPGRLRDVARDRLMLLLVASVILQSVAYQQAFFTLPLAITADGLGTRGYGIAISLNGVLIVLLQPLLLGALGRRGRAPLLLASGVVIGAGLALTAFADTLPTHLAAVTVWTLGELVGAGQLGALIASIAPPHLRGRYMGMYGLSYGVAAFVGPALGTATLDRLGENALWGGCLLLGVLSGAGLFVVARVAARRSG